MKNEGAEPVFGAEEGPTRPGSPPRTATSRWRAVTSVALQRGFGRITDEGLDEAPSAVPSETPGARARGPRETVRLPRSDRGPTGTVRIPRRATPAPPVARQPAHRTWRSYLFFALVACGQLVFLASGSVPGTSAAPATTTPPAGSVASPTPAPASPPAEELEAPEPPAAAATPESAPARSAKAPPRVHVRKTRAASNVF